MLLLRENWWFDQATGFHILRYHHIWNTYSNEGNLKSELQKNNFRNFRYQLINRLWNGPCEFQWNEFGVDRNVVGCYFPGSCVAQYRQQTPGHRSQHGKIKCIAGTIIFTLWRIKLLDLGCNHEYSFDSYAWISVCVFCKMITHILSFWRFFSNRDLLKPCWF